MAAIYNVTMPWCSDCLLGGGAGGVVAEAERDKANEAREGACCGGAGPFLHS